MDRIKQHLLEIKDVELIVLKGHLLLEEQMTRLIDLYVEDAKAISKAELNFHRKVWVLSALLPRFMGAKRESILEINRLRNRLAHNVDFSLFHAQLREWACAAVGYTPKTISRTTTFRNMVVKAFVSFLGAFEGYACCTEEMREHREREQARGHER